MKKVLLGFGVLLSLVIAIFLLSVVSARTQPPPLLVANFVDLEKIAKISKFRSCQGHVTVPQSQKETKRSMKHYFWVKPEYVGSEAIELYAPYDGYVSAIRSEEEEGLEGEIWIIPKRRLPFLPPFGFWQFSVQHIIPKEGLRQGSEVKAGGVIGYAAVPSQDRASFDIVYAKQALVPKMIDNWNSPFSDLDSVFNHMSPEVFAGYEKRGVGTVSEMIISKEQRDANPCRYEGSGPYFHPQDQNVEADWIIFPK